MQFGQVHETFYINDIHFWPFSAQTAGHGYVQWPLNNGAAVNCLDMDNPMFPNIFALGYGGRVWLLAHAAVDAFPQQVGVAHVPGDAPAGHKSVCRARVHLPATLSTAYAQAAAPRPAGRAP